jgi:hypothetical protein
MQCWLPQSNMHVTCHAVLTTTIQYACYVSWSVDYHNPICMLRVMQCWLPQANMHVTCHARFSHSRLNPHNNKPVISSYWNVGPSRNCGVAVSKYVLWRCDLFLAHSFTLYSERLLHRAGSHTHTHTHTYTHTHTHTKERPGLNRENCKRYVTQNKEDCVCCAHSLPKCSVLSKCHTV